MSDYLELYALPDPINEAPPPSLDEVEQVVGDKLRNLNEPVQLQTNQMESANYVPSSTGWKLSPEDSEINVGTHGAVRGGQTAYNTGTGFFLGYSSSAYKFSIGDGSTAYVTWDGSTLDILGNFKLSKSFTADEAISAKDAVVISDATLNISQFDSGNGHASDKAFGVTTSPQKYATKITTTSAISTNTILVWLAKTGIPADNLVVSLQADSSGAPSGSDLTSVSIAAASLTGSAVQYRLTWGAQQSLTASTTYWIVFSRSGALSDINFFDVFGDASGSQDKQYDGSNWSTVGSASREIELDLLSTAGNILQSKASVAGRYNSFLGFAPSAIAKGASGLVVIAGIVTGLTGLSAGSLYYLSDTTGAVATSAGTNTRKVGIAVSTTSMLITNIW